MFANDEWWVIVAPFLDMINHPIIHWIEASIIWPDRYREPLGSGVRMKHVCPSVPTSRMYVCDPFGGTAVPWSQGDIDDICGHFYLQNRQNRDFSGCIMEVKVFHKNSIGDEPSDYEYYYTLDEYGNYLEIPNELEDIVQGLIEEGKFLKIEECRAMIELGI